jgi:hypothetical protein
MKIERGGNGIVTFKHPILTGGRRVVFLIEQRALTASARKDRHQPY